MPQRLIFASIWRESCFLKEHTEMIALMKEIKQLYPNIDCQIATIDGTYSVITDILQDRYRLQIALWHV
ncbi:unnamed protein product [Albugo candida]|uniref:Uncharacterized protein n=1 Tax=Albugo candida TaxID=65357 RepID=A0A024GVV1_9STRA|nr:unnamed protein product [Albugo candida]|eukprot:CCI50862.1 unnamed protein product [Albugo candida]